MPQEAKQLKYCYPDDFPNLLQKKSYEISTLISSLVTLGIDCNYIWYTLGIVVTIIYCVYEISLIFWFLLKKCPLCNKTATTFKIQIFLQIIKNVEVLSHLQCRFSYNKVCFNWKPHIIYWNRYNVLIKAIIIMVVFVKLEY